MRLGGKWLDWIPEINFAGVTARKKGLVQHSNQNTKKTKTAKTKTCAKKSSKNKGCAGFKKT